MFTQSTLASVPGLPMEKREVCRNHPPLNDAPLYEVHPVLCPPDIYFTKREGQCFFLLSRFTAVKKIAKVLDLSPRTVESYINQIKKKMNVSYKTDLIEMAIALVSDLTNSRARRYSHLLNSDD